MNADTLTYRLQGHEKSCFYGIAKYKGEKMAIYYSVQTADGSGVFQIDFKVNDAKHNDIVDSVKESSGDFVFAATAPGEYAFCFSNADSHEKTVYIDLTFESDTTSQTGQPGTEVRHAPGSAGAKKEELKKALDPMENAINQVSDLLGNMQRMQRYFKTRENRNISTGMSL